MSSNAVSRSGIQQRTESLANQLMVLAVAMLILYASLPIIRALPYAGRLVWRAIPEVILLFCVFAKNDAKLLGNYLIVSAFAVGVGYARSLVYANGISENIMSNCIESVFYWHVIVYAYYVLRFFTEKPCLKLLRLAIVLVLISSVTTIAGNVILSGVSRYNSGINGSFPYYLYNVGAYSFIFYIALALVCILFLRKHKTNLKLSKKTMLICAVFVFVCVTVGQLMTALGVAFIALFVLRKEEKLSSLIVFILVGVALLLLAAPILLSVLNATAMWTSSLGFDSLSERLIDIYRALQGETLLGGDIFARFHLYGLSLQHFAENPIGGLIGTRGFVRSPSFTTYQLLEMSSVDAVGQHSDFIDLLGAGGILLFLPFVALLIWYMNKFKKHATASAAYYLMIIVLIQYAVYGIFDHAFSCVDVALAVFLLPALVGKLEIDRGGGC